MTSSGDRFLTIWMTLSILAGVLGGWLTYNTTGNFRQSGSVGIRYFLLAYMLGWVIFKIMHYIERVRPEDGPDEREE